MTRAQLYNFIHDFVLVMGDTKPQGWDWDCGPPTIFAGLIVPKVVLLIFPTSMTSSVSFMPAAARIHSFAQGSAAIAARTIASFSFGAAAMAARMIGSIHSHGSAICLSTTTLSLIGRATLIAATTI